jgi:general secretion pathway protein I
MLLRAEVCSTPREQKGFTLLEVMIALVIVGTAFVACLSLANQCIHTQTRVEHITTATMLAKHKMSELEAQARTSAATDSERSGTYEEPYAVYAWEVEYIPTPLEGIRQVQVSVRWGAEERNEEVVIDSHATSSRKAGARGFTLIEILVAVTITSLVLTGVYGIFSRVSSAEREVRARSTCYHHARSIVNRLQQELGACVLLNDIPTAEFRSEEHGFLTFTSTSVPQADGSVALQQVSYRIEAQDESDTLRLQRYSTPVYALHDDPQWRRMSSKIVELQWRFHDGAGWNDTWDSTRRNTLPQTVELRLILACDGHEIECVTAFDILMAGRV